jgi:membrane-associated protease RseP (regulator of RpoE activity)
MHGKDAAVRVQVGHNYLPPAPESVSVTFMAIQCMIGLIAATTMCLSTGCGPKVNMNPNPFDEDLQPLTKREVKPAPSKVGPGVPTLTLPKLREGDVARADLIAVLDAGPATLLRELDLQAVTDSGNFSGWQIISIVSADSPASLADLQPNDVIGKINGQPIGKPDQLMAVWESLRTAPTLEVEVTRNQVAYSLFFRIVDLAPPPKPVAPASTLLRH